MTSRKQYAVRKVRVSTADGGWANPGDRVTASDLSVPVEVLLAQGVISPVSKPKTAKTAGKGASDG